eukprot:scaffold2875_cov247-Pinguiococcus_pyrenoidosus.AAC.11
MDKQFPDFDRRSDGPGVGRPRLLPRSSLSGTCRPTEATRRDKSSSSSLLATESWYRNVVRAPSIILGSSESVSEIGATRSRLRRPVE